MKKSSLPKIALIGRTNVGKSTLFNRLTEQQAALVSAQPGTTRDRKEADCLWRGKIIRLIDTGGIEKTNGDEMEKQIYQQVEQALEQADIVLFVVDLKEDPLPQDRLIATKLREKKKPLLVVGNKAETPAQKFSVEEKQWKFPGLPKPIPVSALRGTGLGDLLDLIYETLKTLKKTPKEFTEIKATRVAVIGKPNVGKSSLLNSLLKEERFITSPKTQTTREPNDTLFEMHGKMYLLRDTVGIRRKSRSKTTTKLETYGVKRTINLLKKTDVVLLVLDISEPLNTQDSILIGLLQEAQVGIILVANKWDLIKEKKTDTINLYKKYIHNSFPFLRWAPLVFVSAKTGQRTKNLFAIIDAVQSSRSTLIPQKDLDNFLQKAMQHHKPKRGKGPKPPKILELKQVGIAPPRFVLTIQAKRTDALQKTYPRYLENKLHEFFPFEGTSIFIRVKTPKSRGS